MQSYISNSPAHTEELGAKIAAELKANDVIALYGELGAGKTSFVKGMAKGMALDLPVSSPTFALVHEYGGKPALVHFDMYRVNGWEDLYSTGFFDYLETDAVIVIEWSENIEAALPPHAMRISIKKIDDNSRIIEIMKPTD